MLRQVHGLTILAVFVVVFSGSFFWCFFNDFLMFFWCFFDEFAHLVSDENPVVFLLVFLRIFRTILIALILEKWAPRVSETLIFTKSPFSILARFWKRNGSKKASKMEPKWLQKSIKKSMQFLTRKMLVLGAKMAPKWNQNGHQKGTKKGAKLGSLPWDPRGSPKGTKKSQTGPKMEPKWSPKLTKID